MNRQKKGGEAKGKTLVRLAKNHSNYLTNWNMLSSRVTPFDSVIVTPPYNETALQSHHRSSILSCLRIWIGRGKAQIHTHMTISSNCYFNLWSSVQIMLTWKLAYRELSLNAPQRSWALGRFGSPRLGLCHRLSLSTKLEGSRAMLF